MTVDKHYIRCTIFGMWKPATSLDWQSEGLCAQAKNRDQLHKFFSNKNADKYEAKNLCFSCPARSSCLQWALEHHQIWGVWGGLDEFELRRTLSVSFSGKEAKRTRPPHCPFCLARPKKLQVSMETMPGGGRWKTVKVVNCTSCGFAWRSRTSANAVEAYHVERSQRRQRVLAEKNRRQEWEAEAGGLDRTDVAALQAVVHDRPSDHQN